MIVYYELIRRSDGQYYNLMRGFGSLESATLFQTNNFAMHTAEEIAEKNPFYSYEVIQEELEVYKSSVKKNQVRCFIPAGRFAPGRAS